MDKAKNFNKGLVVLVGGTSGAGKDTVIEKLMQKNPKLFGKFVSYATRDPRPDEIDGVHYHFISEQEFLEKIESGEIIEHTTRHNEYKGMSDKIIDKMLARRVIAIKSCEYMGVIGLRDYGYNLFAVYLSVPRDEVKRRLQNRNCPPEELEHRLSDYDDHLSTAKYFDVVVENIDLEKCVDSIYELILQKYHK